MSRLERILSGLLALLLLTLAVIGLLWWRQTQLMNQPLTIENGEQEVRRQHSAQSAYELAQATATNWAGDAQLLEANATWAPGRRFNPRDANWSFTFYAPESGQIALITVVNTQANLFGSRAAKESYQPIPREVWLVDSPELIELIMGNGGQEFMAEHDMVTLRLKLNLNQTPVWHTELIARETGHSLIMWLDAGTGQLLYQEEK